MNIATSPSSARLTLGIVLGGVLALPLSAYRPSLVRAQACEQGDAAEECTRPPIPCSASDDCPEALTCLTTRVVESCPVASAGGSGALASDAGCVTEQEPVEDPRCVLSLVECSADSECGAGWSCQALGASTDCSGSAAGEVCTEQTVHFCFPIPHGCESTSDCDGGWRCVALPDSARENPPPSWEGAIAICAPEGVALYIEGRVETGKITSSEADGDARSNGAAPGSSERDDRASASDSSAGCSVNASSKGSPEAPCGAAFLALLLLARIGTGLRARSNAVAR